MQDGATPTHSTRDLGLQVHVTDGEGVAWHGQVTNLSGGSATLTFMGSDLPHFTMLDELAMSFTSALCRTLPSIHAKVIGRTEEGNTRVYRCLFLSLDEFRALLPEQLGPLFLGRSAPRVHPDASKPVVVQLNKSDGTGFLVQMVDLSTGGISLSIEPEADQTFSKVEEVYVILHFPDVSGGTLLVTMPGVIRRRWLKDGNLYYGVQFADRNRPLCKMGLQAIEEYVHACSHPAGTST